MLTHDVLVIGAGLAGMRAALEAKKHNSDVAILSKVHLCQLGNLRSSKVNLGNSTTIVSEFQFMFSKNP